MTDHHVHIGQFNEVYYDALQVFNAIEESAKQNSVTQVYFSSTSSCRDDAELSKIEEETAYALKFKSEILKVKPYLWFIPQYAEKNINIKSVMGTFDYAGFKIHPFAQKWNLENPIHKKCFQDIFEYAEENQKFILIHSGLDKDCNPIRFEQYFKDYPNAKVILAHSNPAKSVCKLVNNYKNVYCDTAYITKGNLKYISKNIKDKSKILFGTDFPLTQYFNERLFDKKISLSEEYLKDCTEFWNEEISV